MHGPCTKISNSCKGYSFPYYPSKPGPLSSDPNCQKKAAPFFAGTAFFYIIYAVFLLSHAILFYYIHIQFHAKTCTLRYKVVHLAVTLDWLF